MTSRLMTALRLVKFQFRRLAMSFWGRDEAVYRSLVKQGRVKIGHGTYGIPSIHAFDHDPTRLIAGNYCSLGGNYMLGGQHAAHHVTTWPARILWNMEGAGKDGVPIHRGDIVVGSDVWTGYGCFILGGISIGHGAIVATGSVVTKDVPPYAIVGGNPAKVIKYRHTEEQRAALLEIAWWDWPEEKVREAVPYLVNEDIDAFIEWARAN